MISRRHLRDALASMLALCLACPPAQALVSLNDGHDHVYVSGSASFGWDSNIYANQDAKSDYTASTMVIAEYQRRAGWIGVNASAAIEATRYDSHSSENSANPRFSLELTKQTGRTTGSLTLNAARQSRADAAVNFRTTSWNYAAGLNFRYPIVTIYTLSGQVGYSGVLYENNLYSDLATYSASADLIRIFSSERDIMIGYRYRHAETSVSPLYGEDSSYDDHSATVGMSGKLIRGLHGSLRAGYQARLPNGRLLNGQRQPDYGSWTASGSATYALNKRTNLTGSLSKDFSTTGLNQSVDTLTASLDVQYAVSSRWSLSATVAAGNSDFLGESGRILVGTPPAPGPQRQDTFLSASASIGYTLHEHLRIAGTYAWFKNSSNMPFADFVRSSYNLNLSSRW